MGPYDGDLVAREICPCKPSYFRVVDKAQGVSQYEWTLTGDGLPAMYAGERADFHVSQEGRYAISCRQYHEGCGWSEPTVQSFYASSMAGNCPSCNGHIISPNPGNGVIRIAPRIEVERGMRDTEQAQPIRSVRIFSPQGAQVLYRTFGSGMAEVHVDISALRTGVYTVLINEQQTETLIKE
ncbi:MAG: T9SS type A sorting domain-containing protein [Bacteroidales bacterium]|nr:T9SS type A sorting domain-containing protein [Bacteroidales bacterium]